MTSDPLHEQKQPESVLSSFTKLLGGMQTMLYTSCRKQTTVIVTGIIFWKLLKIFLSNTIPHFKSCYSYFKYFLINIFQAIELYINWWTSKNYCTSLTQSFNFSYFFIRSCFIFDSIANTSLKLELKSHLDSISLRDN